MIASVAVLAVVGVLFGAIAGSFATVLVQRLPRLIDEADGNPSPSRLLHAISWPPSHCAQCTAPIAWRDNIPIVSYVLRRGRCRSCGSAYGMRYIAVELATALAFAGCAIGFGLTAQALFVAILAAGLIALTAIDIEEQLLPDLLLAPLFALGLLYQILYGAGWIDAALGAAAGSATLGLIRYAHMAVREVEGLGLGDVKFAAVIGAWIGLAAMPAALTIAFASGTAILLSLALSGRASGQTAVPFGPFLALGCCCAMFAPELTRYFAVA